MSSVYVKSIISKFKLDALIKLHDLNPVHDGEVVTLNHFKINGDWTEVGVDGEREEFFDSTKYNSRDIRNKIIEAANYFYIGHANEVSEIWIRKGSSFIMIANNDL